MENKGFIKTPFLIAIVVGVLVLGGVGYFRAEQYRSYQKGKEQIQQQTETQQKALQEAQQEIDKLKTESEQSKNQQNILEQKINQEASKPKATTINAAELAPYLSGIVNIICGNNKGSASLWNIKNHGMIAITNQHMIEDSGGTFCYFVSSEFSPPAFYYLYFKDKFTWNDETDIIAFPIVAKAIPVEGMSTPWLVPIEKLNYKLSYLKKCDMKMPVGSSVVIIGYPAFGEQAVEYGGIKATQSNQIVTNGIISGQDTIVSSNIGTMPYPNYFVSAKVDSGNSGGMAFSKDNNGLCVLGVPTWLSIGNYETQGIVQNINNVMYQK